MGDPASPAARVAALEWVLRVGACLCFVGHGAFGVLTKPAWVPYFAVVGIGPQAALGLMPWVGLLDLGLGVLMLVRPAPAAAGWMALWAAWTALLRPLSGEPLWEALERAGNCGVPAAFLLLALPPRGGLDLWGAARLPAPTLERLRQARRLLTATVVLLLAGHGALGLLGKPGLVANCASVLPPGAAAALTPLLGSIELALAAAVALRPAPALLVGVAAWKLGTEALFLTAGSPVWEVVERGGSYAAPLALALVVRLLSPGLDRPRVEPGLSLEPPTSPG